MFETLHPGSCQLRSTTMCNRSRWIACLVAVFCVNLLIVRPGFADFVVTTIPGHFPMISPANGFKFTAFQFQQGLTDAVPGATGIENHAFPSLAFTLGSAATPTGGAVT